MSINDKNHNNNNNNYQGLLSFDEGINNLRNTKQREIDELGNAIFCMDTKYNNWMYQLMDTKKRVSRQIIDDLNLRVKTIDDKLEEMVCKKYDKVIKEYKDKIKALQDKVTLQNGVIDKLSQEVEKRNDMNGMNGMITNRGTSLGEIDSGIHELSLPLPLNNNLLNMNDIDTNSNENISLQNESLQRSHSPQNLFNAMPRFDINDSIDKEITITNMTGKILTDGEMDSDDDNDDESDESDESGNDGDNEKDEKIKIKKRKKKKRKKKKKKKKHKKKRKKHKYKTEKKEKYYKYHKNEDDKFLTKPKKNTPAPARQGDTDKTWLHCRHKIPGTDGKICGIKWIRSLKDRGEQAQHYCDGDPQQKLITRRFGSYFGGCKYCDASLPCTRLATIDEIEEHQNKLRRTGMVPNTRGGYKAIGAKETIDQPQRVNSGKGIKRRKKRKKKRSNSNNQRSKSVGCGESKLPKNEWRTESDDDYDDEDSNEEQEGQEMNNDYQPPNTISRKRKRHCNMDASSDSEYVSWFLSKYFVYVLVLSIMYIYFITTHTICIIF